MVFGFSGTYTLKVLRLSVVARELNVGYLHDFSSTSTASSRSNRTPESVKL